MSLDRCIERDSLARKIVLAYQNSEMRRLVAFNGLVKLGWRPEVAMRMLDTVDTVLKGRDAQ
jgi:hypothetical protein